MNAKFPKYLILTAIGALCIAALVTLVRYDMAISVLTRMLLCALAAVCWMTIVYAIARRHQRLDIVDVAWGMTFIVIACVGFMLQDGKRSLFDAQTVTTLMVIVWGLRLSVSIGNRYRRSGVQDPRYTALQHGWKDHPKLRNYLGVFVLQALLAVVIAVPVIHINLWKDTGETTWSVVGFIVWLFGLFYESIADWQLQRFLTQPTNKGKLLVTGLRRFSRYPNYFGELCVWWGFALISLGTTHGWVGLVGALTITYLLLYVSGVPLAEASSKKKDGWDRYASRTSVLVPWFPR